MVLDDRIGSIGAGLEQQGVAEVFPGVFLSGAGLRHRVRFPNNLRLMSNVTAEQLRRSVRARAYRSVVNQAHLDQATLGERLADRIASGIGSWTFLIVQTILVLLWVVVNLLGIFAFRWDPYPFILLNLMFSVQAAYTGPVLLLAGNRQAQKDRLTLEHAALEAERADEQDRKILTEIKQNTEITVSILQRLEQPEAKTH
jgi:uncharacterized membrane protein